MAIAKQMLNHHADGRDASIASIQQGDISIHEGHLKVGSHEK